MKECKYRILIDKSEKYGVTNAFNIAVRPLGVRGAAVAGTLKQSFDCGLCELLTQNDIGPMECQQPEHNEKTCPDIDHLR
jgi:hypothetical protein